MLSLISKKGTFIKFTFKDISVINKFNITSKFRDRSIPYKEIIIKHTFNELPLEIILYLHK